MGSRGEPVGQADKFCASDVSFVLSNLKKSAAAMLQDKERSRHSESVWRERLTEKERRVAELERIVHSEQQKSAAVSSTIEERTSIRHASASCNVLGDGACAPTATSTDHSYPQHAPRGTQQPCG